VESDGISGNFLNNAGQKISVKRVGISRNFPNSAGQEISVESDGISGNFSSSAGQEISVRRVGILATYSTSEQDYLQYRCIRKILDMCFNSIMHTAHTEGYFFKSFVSMPATKYFLFPQPETFYLSD
jgi:hypothetical protein